MSNSHILELENVMKIYKTGDIVFEALRGVSLVVESGQWVAIQGPSGSGKSTLLNLIGCLDRPTSGRILIEGVDVSKINDNKLAEIRGGKIGFIFQMYNLIPSLTVVENILLPTSFIKKLRKTDVKQRTEEIMKRLGISHLKDRFPSKLSGGETQRVTIARALINEPSLILADEPTGNLDTSTGSEIAKLFKDIHEQGETIILVTHDNEFARKAEKIYVLRDGELKTQGR
ncbi:MAG: ABC transporter ATP-binding protein [Candidatus Jordarchaeum sp.]|uniref:ABC transporter ATP-binding protein n=1 Tax=Candidatus Jordarchaeum sp. TaxID=2823881 RepID=UPI00404B8BC6